MAHALNSSAADSTREVRAPRISANAIMLGENTTLAI
jgi:hypothetical protein